MKLRQLQFIREVADNGFSISQAAATLLTSQPSVSRQIQSLERELGVPIFERYKGRITGITRPGRAIVQGAVRIVNECKDLQRIGDEYACEGTGVLTVAASHTHACYVLPTVITQFTKVHPLVRLSLRQGNPNQIAAWVSTGEADVCIGTAPLASTEGVLFVPCSKHHRIVLAPRSHPLARMKPKHTLEALARYPLITYDKSFAAYGQIVRAFARRGLQPNIVLSATDVAVMKTYVRSGLGIAIIASLAYAPSEDRDLCAIDVRHLFESGTINLGVKRGGYLTQYVRDFIEIFAPGVSGAL